MSQSMKSWEVADRVPEVKERIKGAFAALRKVGYLARMNFLCCGGCASYALHSRFTERGIPQDDPRRKAVYYHHQDGAGLESARKPEDLGVYLGWAGDGAEIVAALRAAGLEVEWDGTKEQRIWAFLSIAPAVDPIAEQYVSFAQGGAK